MGNAALEILYHQERFTSPLKRNGEGFSRMYWEEAIDLMGSGLGLDFDYPDAASVLSEINRTVPQYGGITRERLGKSGLIWPCSSTDQPGTHVLHSSGFKFAEGRASIMPVLYRPAAEDASWDYPYYPDLRARGCAPQCRVHDQKKPFTQGARAGSFPKDQYRI